MRTGIDIKAMFDMRDHHTSGFGVDQGSIGSPGEQGVLTHPQKIRLELISAFNRMSSIRNHIAAAGVYFSLEDQSNRLPGGRISLRTAPGDNFLNTARYPRGADAHTVAGLGRATGDTPGKSPEIEIRTVDPLHGHGKRTGCVTVHGRGGVEPLYEGRPLIPRHRGMARLESVLTLKG